MSSFDAKSEFRLRITGRLESCGGILSQSSLEAHTLAEMPWLDHHSFDSMLKQLASSRVVELSTHAKSGVAIVKLLSTPGVASSPPVVVQQAAPPVPARAPPQRIPNATAPPPRVHSTAAVVASSNIIAAPAATAPPPRILSTAVVATAANHATSERRREREEKSPDPVGAVADKNSRVRNMNVAGPAVMAPAAPAPLPSSSSYHCFSPGMAFFYSHISPLAVPPPLLVKAHQPVLRTFADDSQKRVLVLLPPPRVLLLQPTKGL